MIFHGVIVRRGWVRAAKVSDNDQAVEDWLKASLSRATEIGYILALNDGVWEIKSPEEYRRLLRSNIPVPRTVA